MFCSNGSLRRALQIRKRRSRENEPRESGAERRGGGSRSLPFAPPQTLAAHFRGFAAYEFASRANKTASYAGYSNGTSLFGFFLQQATFVRDQD